MRKFIVVACFAMSLATDIQASVSWNLSSDGHFYSEFDNSETSLHESDHSTPVVKNSLDLIWDQSLQEFTGMAVPTFSGPAIPRRETIGVGRSSSSGMSVEPELYTGQGGSAALSSAVAPSVAIPEPLNFCMVLIGLVGLIWLKRSQLFAPLMS